MWGRRRDVRLDFSVEVVSFNIDSFWCVFSEWNVIV